MARRTVGVAVLAAMVAAFMVPAQQAMAAGARADFDGDGKGDVAIGVPGEDVGGFDRAGAVNVLYGSSTGLTNESDQFFHQNNLEDEAEENDGFGTATAAGDFDDDGYADLAIGAPGESAMLTANHGAVHVIYGSSDGLDTAAGEDFFTESDIGVDSDEAENRFGAALAAGDFNDDGYADLAIGHPGEDVGSADGAGAVTVLYGAPDGLDTGTAQLWNQDTTGIEGVADAAGSGNDEAFGSALARRDFNGDGIADLAIGVPGDIVGDTEDAGAVNVIYGTDDGLAAAGNQLLNQDVDGIRDEAEEQDAFGSALAGGDFDGDGYGDIAIGVPTERVRTYGNQQGAVAILHGSSDGLSPEADRLLHQNLEGMPSSARGNEAFGAALAAGDFDGNGKDDLAIGVPNDYLPNFGYVGAVHVLYGRSTGLSLTGDDYWHQAVPNVLGQPQYFDRFGEALLARNVGRGARADLIVGVPHEDAGPSADEVEDAGRVQVLFGGTSGLTAANNQQWQQDTRGIADDGETEDLFGASLG